MPPTNAPPPGADGYLSAPVCSEERRATAPARPTSTGAPTAEPERGAHPDGQVVLDLARNRFLKLSPTAAEMVLRHILVHGYFEIDPDVVWNAITESVPRLKPQIDEQSRTWLTKQSQDIVDT